MLSKVLVATAAVSAVIMALILTTTTPASAGAFGILAIFVLTYLFLLASFTFLLWSISRLIVYIGGMFAPRRPIERITLQRAYFYSTILALAPVIVVSMQSVGAIGPYELGLIMLLVILGCIYVTKRTTD